MTQRFYSLSDAPASAPFRKPWMLAGILLCFMGCNFANAEHPGFRPESELAAAFLESVKSAKVAVYPVIIRTVAGTSYSEDSQKQVVSMLNEKQVTAAVAKADTIDPGELKGEGQLALFQNDLKTIAEQLKGFDSDADYSLVMEVLFPPLRPAVFGIHCYVYDRQGENAFSFLLNSHHKLFVDADMTAEDSSEASRAEMMEKATKVGVTALMQQIDFGP